MPENEWLADKFETHRSHLRAVAYRMLGSLSEADDAVQESWLRLSRADTSAVENLGGWLTTVVARVCLDALRSRKSRREDSLDTQVAEPLANAEDSHNPEHEAQLADSVGLALLVVLDTLTPAERLAFVLHDLFGVSFDEIAEIVGRSEMATRQLASRARRKVQGVQGTTTTAEAELRSQRKVVDAFLAALRARDFEGLVAVLDPDLVVRVDAAAAAGGAATEVRGAQNWASGAVNYARGARFVEPALIDGAVGLVLAPKGRLFRALSFVIKNGKIVEIEVMGDPARLQQLELSVLSE